MQALNPPCFLYVLHSIRFRMLLPFLCDVMDSAVSSRHEDLVVFVELEKGLIKYDALCASPVVHRNLLFHHIWRTFFKRIATKMDFYLYTTSAVATTPDTKTEEERMIQYILSETYLRLAQVQPPVLNGVREGGARYYARVKTDAAFVLQELKAKILDRFGAQLRLEHPDQLDAWSLYKVYKHVTHLCHTACMPDHLKSVGLDDASASAHDVIEKGELLRRNPLTASRHPRKLPDTYLETHHVSVEEALRYILTADQAYARLHLQSDCVVVPHGDGAATRALLCLLRGLHDVNPSHAWTVYCTDETTHQEVSALARELDTYMRITKVSPPMLAHLPCIHRTCLVFQHGAHVMPHFPGLSKDLNRNVIVYVDSGSTPQALQTSNPYTAATLYAMYDRMIVLYDGARTFYPSEDLTLFRVYGVPLPTTTDADGEAMMCFRRVLSDPLFFKHLMTKHVTLTCPLRTSNIPANNYLYVMDAILRYLTPKQDARIVWNDTPLPTTNALLLIDTRMNIMSVLSCYMAMYHMRELVDASVPWRITLVTHASAVNDYKRFLPCAQFVTYPHMRKTYFNMECYNAMLKDADFWGSLLSLGVQKCWIVQDDAFLLRPITYLFWNVLQPYTYIGAPWDKQVGFNRNMGPFVHPSYVGNGGFSLRDVADMIRVCQKHADEAMELYHVPFMTLPEDVFFSKRAARVCPFDVACRFAMEEVYTKDALAVHKFWAYHHITKVQDYFDNLLQS